MAVEAAEVAAEGRAAAWAVDWPFTGPTRAWSFLTVQTLPLESRRLPCVGSMDLTVNSPYPRIIIIFNFFIFYYIYFLYFITFYILLYL